MTGRVNINVADVLAEPKYRSERISQALFYEPVGIIDETEGFLKIKSWDDYEGWTARQFISEHKDFEGEGPFIVSSNLAPAFERAEANSRRLVSIPYGCELYGEQKGDFLLVRSERYGDIYMRITEFTGPYDINRHPRLDAADLVGEAEKFLGSPYLWGGRSFFGIDCSGFVQAIMKRFGIALPRDTKDQIDVGAEVKREDIRAGDRLYFPRHVTLAVSDTLMIHSSTSNGGVSYNSLDSESPVYSRHYDESLIVVRRTLE